MFIYYLDLARRSFKRNIGLTLLMVIAIAFGIGASMTTLTVLHVLSADPIPGKTKHLHMVQLDARHAAGYTPGQEPQEQLTRLDAEALVRARRADRQVMMTGGTAAIDPERPGLAPFRADARWTSADFFRMFEVPFIAGGGWTAEDDGRAARVVVISSGLATKLFGETNVVGRTVRIAGAELRVIGVTAPWSMNPHFYDLSTDVYGRGEQVFVPFSTSRELRLPRSGSTECWGATKNPEEPTAPCAWIQLWVELDSDDKAAAYRDFLVRYSEEQRAAGRYQRAPNVALRTATEWIAFKQAVPRDVRMQTWVALGFLFVCLINTVGLLLAKFLRRSTEIGVRRALGASRRSIFVQLLVESGMVGLAGGALGLGLACLGLWAVRHQPTAYAELAQLDLPMLAATFALAVATAVLAGLLPAWRACQVAPAIQLKSQ